MSECCMFVTLRLRGGDYPEFTGLYASFLGVWQQAREKIKKFGIPFTNICFGKYFLKTKLKDETVTSQS